MAASAAVMSPADQSDTSTSSQYDKLSSINAQLLTHGWAKRPLNLQILPEKDYKDVVGVMFELLGASVNNINTLDALAARHRTLQYEYERIQKAQNNVKVANARLESEVAGWKARCADVEKRLALEESKTKELREEVGRGRKALDGVRVAAGHEAKKSQMKLDKAQAQLLRLSNDSSQKTQGFVLLNPIPAGRIQPVVAGQIPLLEQTLRELTEIRESLQEETEAFRHVVVTTGNGLREALALAAGQEPPARLMHSQFFSNADLPTRPVHLAGTHTFQSASSTSHPTIANNRLQLLINDVRTKLTDGVPTPLRNGAVGAAEPSPEEIEEQKRVDREQEKTKRDLEDRVKDLEVEVICAKAREEEAKKVAEEMAKLHLEQGMAKMTETQDGTVDEQRAAMEEESKKFAEAAGRLRQERLQLEAERQAFIEEKRQADVDAVLALLPSTPSDASERGLEPIAETESVALAVSISAPSSPGPSSWAQYRPHSPSPLSPSHAHTRNRTPMKHAAAGRRKSIKTPLSRLVLEKAVRQKGRERSSDTAAAASYPTAIGTSTSAGRERREKDRLGTSVLAPEGGRRTNALHQKGKDRAVSSSSSTLKTSEHIQASTFGKSTSTSTSGRSSSGSTSSTSTGKPGLPPSALRSSTLGVSTSRKVDLGRGDGIGPRAAAKPQRPWR